jgi:hypothetical protein
MASSQCLRQSSCYAECPRARSGSPGWGRFVRVRGLETFGRKSVSGSLKPEVVVLSASSASEDAIRTCCRAMYFEQAGKLSSTSILRHRNSSRIRTTEVNVAIRVDQLRARRLKNWSFGWQILCEQQFVSLWSTIIANENRKRIDNILIIPERSPAHRRGSVECRGRLKRTT